MGLVITSKVQALRHGAYIIEQTPPAIVNPIGVGVAAIVAQFPWGPAQTLVTPSSTADRIATFAPPGMDHTGSGYLCMTQKAFPLLKVVRVVAASGEAAATATVNKTGPTAMLTLTLNSVGTAGNAVTWQTTAASDGDPNHFNLIVTVSGASGNTVDQVQNLNYSGVGADSTPNLTSLRLLGSITKLTSGVPILTTGTFSGGTDGAVVSSDYVGTQGLGDKGFAKLEGDKTIRHFFTDDPGSSLRSAVNTGGQAHADFEGDRIFYTNGPSGQSVSAAQTDVANFRSINVIYVDPWCYVNNDVDGTMQLVPSAPFAASLGANLSPSTSIAWKNNEATRLLDAIVKLEADRGDAAAANTAQGIVTLIPELAGGFSFEAGVNTEAPVDPSKKTDTRTRMLQYIGTALVGFVRPFTDGPNTTDNQQNIVEATDRFLDNLKRNSTRDSNHLPNIIDYSIAPLSSVNDSFSLANGEFSIPISIQLPAPMSKIFFLLNIGETVTITSQG